MLPSSSLESRTDKLKELAFYEVGDEASWYYAYMSSVALEEPPHDGISVGQNLISLPAKGKRSPTIWPAVLES